MVRALVLYSGGLDSRLAVKMLEEQGIEAVPVMFKIPFSCCPPHIPFYKDNEIIIVDYTKGQNFLDYMKLVRDPKYGTGTAVNPCIDCKILMFKKAKEMLKEFNCDFIASGEVLGERPMSQHKDKLTRIEDNVGIEILRPLSAKVLPETSFEKDRLVDREKLGDIRGRQRKKQIALAKKWKIEYPTPGGGCILCERTYAPKLTDILEHKTDEELTVTELRLLKSNRHFRGNKKIILGRNEIQNLALLEANKILKWNQIIPTTPGPVVIYEDKADEELVNKIQFSYSKEGTKEDKEEVEKYRIK